MLFNEIISRLDSIINLTDDDNVRRQSEVTKAILIKIRDYYSGGGASDLSGDQLVIDLSERVSGIIDAHKVAVLSTLPSVPLGVPSGSITKSQQPVARSKTVLGKYYYY